MSENEFSASFFNEKELQLIEQFSRQGYVVVPLGDMNLVENIRDKVCRWAGRNNDSVGHEQFLNGYHSDLEGNVLNEKRLSIIGEMKNDKFFRPEIYRVGKEYIDCIVGNELSMQTACNLSIQLPNDDKSLLPIHADVWSGNSPYEIVFWLPLVDCYKTKSMYVVGLEDTREIYEEFPDYSHLNADELYKQIEHRVVYLDVPFGSAVIFWHGLLHGNRVNVEEETRWSINVRFKSLLSPYGSKEIGESFLPITTKPLTRLGFNYRDPVL